MKLYNPKDLSKIKEEKQENAKRENNIVKVPTLESDVQEVAELTAYVLEDSAMVAELASYLLEDSTVSGEVLAIALEKITELEARIEQLEGGK